MAAIIGTWSFSLEAIKAGKALLLGGNSAVNTIEDSISVVENDPATGVYFIGRGGYPNSQGILECDAAIMDGYGLKYGGVAAIQGVPTPIRVARLVLDRSPLSMLVGQGATQFAEHQGFKLEPNDELVAKTTGDDCHGGVIQKTHDTLGLIVRDRQGNLAAGVSTSGVGGKAPGRVGDSPLPGGGLYADNEAGAACTTGDGDQILRYCPSHQAVRLMADGLHPRDACVRVIQDITRRQQPHMFEMGIIAMNKQGETGAAGSLAEWQDVMTSRTYPGFPYGVWSEKEYTEETILTVPQTWHDHKT